MAAEIGRDVTAQRRRWGRILEASPPSLDPFRIRWVALAGKVRKPFVLQTYEEL